MHLSTIAGGGGTEAAQEGGGREAGAAEKEGGVSERPGEAEGRTEEAGEGQGGRAAAVRQDGGAPSGWGKQGHFGNHNNNNNHMICCSLQKNSLFCYPLCCRGSLTEPGPGRIQCFTQWHFSSFFMDAHIGGLNSSTLGVRHSRVKFLSFYAKTSFFSSAI